MSDDAGTPSPIKGGVLATLRAAFRRRPGTVGAAMVLALTAAGASLVAPLLVRSIVTNISSGGSLARYGALLAVLTLGGALASGWSSYLLGRAGEYGTLAVRRRVVEHVLRMRLYDVRRIGVGDVVSRGTVDATQLRSITDVSITALPTSLVMVTVSLIVMGFLNWILLVVVIVTFALAAVAIRFFLRAMRRANSARQEALGALGERLSSTLGSLAVVKASQAETTATEPVIEEARAAADSAISADRSQAFISPVMSLAQQISLIAVLTGSGALLASGRLAPGDFVAFLMYLFQLVSPLMLVASAFGRIQRGLAAVGRIDELLDKPQEDGGPPGGAESPGYCDDALEFRHVGAGYDGTEILRGTSLTIPARGLTALVGGSGAGKSTVLKLIEKFLTPYRGSIHLHGRDLADWRLESLRGRLAYVDQSITLLTGTIRDNLVTGLTDPPSDDTLFATLAKVDLARDIALLSDGLDTWIGSDVDLSGGQRQRLALARALLRPADVFLLDEPTSQLDGFNEQRLVQIMEELVKERAVVVVAHRLSTVRHARHIVYLEEGEVAGQGSHEHLNATCGGYRALLRSQAPDGAPSQTNDTLVHSGRSF